MGASGWIYYVPYQDDVAAAVAELQAKIFADGAYYWPNELSPGRSSPATLDGLRNDALVVLQGTHSILDVDAVVAHDQPDRIGTVRALSPDDSVRKFGTVHPTRADIERLYEASVLYDDCPRGSGRFVILWHDGTPTGIVLWGLTGD